jgi:hypothetical protein
VVDGVKWRRGHFFLTLWGKSKRGWGGILVQSVIGDHGGGKRKD